MKENKIILDHITISVSRRKSFLMRLLEFFRIFKRKKIFKIYDVTFHNSQNLFAILRRFEEETNDYYHTINTFNAIAICGKVKNDRLERWLNNNLTTKDSVLLFQAAIMQINIPALANSFGLIKGLDILNPTGL